MNQLMFIGIFCNVILIGVIYKEISMLKALSMGVTAYFFLYIFSSGILFWVDSYSISRATLLTAILSIFIMIFLVVKNKKFPEFTFKKKEWGILLVLLLLVLPMTSEKFEFFGMGQDQGVYQTKAVELINGNTNRIYDFDEYEILENDEQKEQYYNTVKDLAGYDLVDQRKPTLVSVQNVSDVAGIYHGIPTWASILALFGDMFGISHMQNCQTLFFIVLLLLVYYILENLKIRTALEIPAVLILGLSPQVLWVSKSALTEMFLAVIIASFVMLVTEKDIKLRFLSSVSVVVFSFFHVTIYTMIPMFLLIYWGLYLISHEKNYVHACNISLLGYLVGFLFMLYASPTYTTYNYVRPLESIPFVNDASLPYLVACATLLALIFTNVLPFIEKNSKIDKIKDFLYEKRGLFLKIIVLSLLGVFLIKCVNNYESFAYLGNFTLVSYAAATGVVLLPAVLLMMVFADKDRLKGEAVYVIVTFLVYTILIYSVFLRLSCAFYYYYGRYLVPFLFIIVVVFCYFANSFNKYRIWMLCFLGGLFFVEPDTLIMSEVDDSRMSWEAVENAMEITKGESTAVIVQADLRRLLFLPLSSIGSAVYNSWGWDKLIDETEFLSQHYETIYYITNEIYESEDFYPLYRDYYTNSEYSADIMQAVSGYPLNVLQKETCITIYRYNKVRMEYNVFDKNSEQFGLGTVENNYYAWTTNEQVSFACYLELSDYECVLTQGPGIPLTELGISSYNIEVYVNDEYLTTLCIDNTNNGKELSFYIPEGLLSEKKNIVSFKSPLWSPSDYGVNDSKQRGFSFASMRFDKVETEMEYPVTDKQYRITGIGNVEDDRFAWTNSENVTMMCYLEEKSYDVSLTQGAMIPFDNLGIDKYEIDVFVNNEYLSTLIIDQENSGGKVSFQIPASMIKERVTYIRFESELWSPSDYGLADTRKLGFGFAKLEFHDQN